MIELTNLLKTRPERIDARLSLTYDERQKLRLKTRLDDSGEEAWLLRVRATGGLKHGDVLKATDGRIVEVLARPEPLLEVRSGDALLLARAAYHLGNRHAHVQVGAGYLRCERDHVLADMLAGLGLPAAPVDAPFEPEPGAYAGGHTHHADGARHAGRIHEHNSGALQYADATDAAPAQPHVHGPGCGHDDHAHDHAAHGHDHRHDHGHHHGHHHGQDCKQPPHRHGPGCGHDH